MAETKICSNCGILKPATSEYFQIKNKGNIDRLTSECKTCKAEQHKLYYQENKERIAEQQRQYREENKDKIAEREKKYREKNKENSKPYGKLYYQENKKQLNEYGKQYYKENKEIILKNQRLYYQENKEKMLEHSKQWAKENKEYNKQYNKQYYQANKEIIAKQARQWKKENKEHLKKYREANPHIGRQNDLRYRAKKSQLPNTFTSQQYTKALQYFDNSCAYCGMTAEEHKLKWNEPLHQEHFLAQSKGGGYTHNNIIPACRSCNTSKWNHNFFEWYPKQESYSVKREKKILAYLNYQDRNIQQLSVGLL